VIQYNEYEKKYGFPVSQVSHKHVSSPAYDLKKIPLSFSTLLVPVVGFEPRIL
jgi:hypothetical protein